MRILSLVIPVLMIGLLTVGPTPAQAQTDSTAITTPQAQPTAQPTAKPTAERSAGAFSRGSKRAGIYGGAGSTLGNTYMILGAGVAFFVLDGLEVGIDGEGWLFQDPTIWKVSPQVRYTLWQLGALRPYVGAFWRRTFVSSDYDDFDSWGGRAGLTYARGNGYVGAGIVYERFDSKIGDDQDTWYPEVSFSMYF